MARSVLTRPVWRRLRNDRRQPRRRLNLPAQFQTRRPARFPQATTHTPVPRPGAPRDTGRCQGCFSDATGALNSAAATASGNGSPLSLTDRRSPAIPAARTTIFVGRQRLLVERILYQVVGDAVEQRRWQPPHPTDSGRQTKSTPSLKALLQPLPPDLRAEQGPIPPRGRRSFSSVCSRRCTITGN